MNLVMCSLNHVYSNMRSFLCVTGSSLVRFPMEIAIPTLCLSLLTLKTIVHIHVHFYPRENPIFIVNCDVCIYIYKARGETDCQEIASAHMY